MHGKAWMRFLKFQYTCRIFLCTPSPRIVYRMENGQEYKKTYEYKYPITLIEFDKIRRGGLHPTQKPVALLEYLIKTYTNEGETVLDNCMGSGSTGVACVNTNRNFIGYELDEHYFQIAKERLEQHECKTNI